MLSGQMRVRDGLGLSQTETLDENFNYLDVIMRRRNRYREKGKL